MTDLWWGPQIPGRPTSNIYLDQSKGSRTCYIKNPLLHTVWIEFAGTEIPKWNPCPISYLFFDQYKVSRDLCFNLWTSETLHHGSPLISPVTKYGNKKSGHCKCRQFNDHPSNWKSRNRSHDWQWGRILKIWIVPDHLFTGNPPHAISESVSHLLIRSGVWTRQVTCLCLSFVLFMKLVLFYHSHFQVASIQWIMNKKFPRGTVM